MLITVIPQLLRQISKKECHVFQITHPWLQFKKPCSSKWLLCHIIAFPEQISSSLRSPLKIHWPGKSYSYWWHLLNQCESFRGWMGKTKYLKKWKCYGNRCQAHQFECQELQCCWVFHIQQFSMCIKNGPPPKGHPANLPQLWEASKSTWASISVERLTLGSPVPPPPCYHGTTEESIELPCTYFAV